MRGLRVWFAVAGMMLLAAPATAVGTSEKSTLDLLWEARNRTVLGADGIIQSRFRAVEQDVPTIVARLANEHNVLCGIAVVPYPPEIREAPAQPPFKRLNVEVEGVVVRDLLNLLVQADPNFEWREDNGVVNVALRGTFGNEKHPLNTVIPRFEVNDVPYYFALFGNPTGETTGLFRTGDLTSRLGVGLVYSGPPLDTLPRVSVSASNKTVLQIVNDVARQLRLCWQIFDSRLIGGKMVLLLMELQLLGTADLSPFVPRSGTQSSTDALPAAVPSAPSGGAPTK